MYRDEQEIMKQQAIDLAELRGLIADERKLNATYRRSLDQAHKDLGVVRKELKDWKAKFANPLPGLFKAK